MGGVSQAVGSVFGGGKGEARAARNAADAQLQSTREAVDFQKESRDLARADLAPFVKLGTDNIQGLQDLITNPEAQLDFVQNNKFFQALRDDAQETIFSNQAAKGKVGSGSTAEALQNSFLLLGQDLVNNSINQRLNLTNIGQASAAGQAVVAQNTGATISDLITQGGNAQAAGIIGAQNARTAADNRLIGIGEKVGEAIALSDIRLKENIKYIGRLGDNHKGVNIYAFTYIEDPTHTPQIGVMAQEIQDDIPNAVIEDDGVLYVDYGEIANYFKQELH